MDEHVTHYYEDQPIVDRSQHVMELALWHMDQPFDEDIEFEEDVTVEYRNGGTVCCVVISAPGWQMELKHKPRVAAAAAA